MSLLPTGLPDLGASPATAARLRVDRESLPKLRRVFNDALAKLDVQINEAITAVRVSPWAGDPVSENAASRFNDHSINDADSALNVLMADPGGIPPLFDAAIAAATARAGELAE